MLSVNKTTAQKAVSTPALEADMERASLLMPWDNADKHIKENIFIKVIANKKTCFVGEPILVTYKLFTRLQSHSKVVDAPAFTGCSVIEMTTNDLKQEREIVGGKLYKTFIIRKVQLLPLQEGVLSLGQVQVDNEVNLYQSINGGYNNLNKQVRLTNNVEAISIKPLPNDTSKNPIGVGIGKFFITGRVSKSVDTANDNNALELTITGSGNFMNIACPLVQWPAGVQAYEPKVSERLDKLSFPVLGEKKFVIPFTCKQVGELVIPIIKFTYFNIDSGRYCTSKLDSIHVKVLPEVPLVDQEKLTKGIDNLKYLWIIPGIAAVVGIVMLFFSTKKKKATNQLKPDEGSETNNQVSKKNTADYLERLTALQLNIDSNSFYSTAKELANNVSEEATTDVIFKNLEEIIALCNEALYAFKEVDRVQIITLLRQQIEAL